LSKTKISEFMVENPISVRPEMDVYEAAQEILTNQVSGATVIDENGKLVGMLSELDCLKAIVTSVYNGADPGGALVGEIMTSNVEVNDPDEGILAVATSMLDHKHRRRPVVKDGVLQGQLTCRQILKAVTDYAEDSHPEDLEN
jgi:CBS domain-containing protein